MTTLRLLFLGPPRIERQGRVVAADTRKATALLAYVALRGEPQTRDALAALLWPDFDTARARAALRRTLSALKTAVGAQVLAITRETVGLQPGRIWCDVLHFQELAARTGDRAALETAVALYRADFLDGFSLRDSIPFDDWQVWQAQHLRQALEQALLQLIDLAVNGGAYAAALPLAQRLLALDPLREETQRTLMQLYAWLGQPNAALRQYRACVRVLDEELGVPPLPETTALYEAIQQARSEPFDPPPAGPQIALPPLPGAAHPSPLVGREEALAQMERALARVGPAVQFLILGGEAGIGKTRLVEHFAGLSRAGGAHVLSARCYAGESNLAYAPLIQLLREGIELPGARERLAALPSIAQAARLLPELTPPEAEAEATAPEAPGAQSRFFEGVGQVLAALLDGPVPGILCIDDAHWLDAATLAVLLFWTRRHRQRPYLLLLALREDELAANTPLQQALAEMQRAGRAEWIHLRRLAVRDVAALLAAAQPDCPPGLADRLFKETEGLPYFVVEYLAELAHSPPPVSSTQASWPMPHSVRDLLRERLARVSGAAQQLMQTAAAIGQPFPFDLAQVASGRTEEEALAGLEDLLGRAVLVEEGEQYDFSHEKLRALAYEEMSLARRRLLHRRVAEALAARAGRALQSAAAAAQIGAHYRLAGADMQAAACFRQAGDYARDLYAHRDALAYYELALALDDTYTALLHEACADLHTRLGEYGAALDRYERAAAQGAGSDLGRLEHKLARVYQRLGDWPLAAHKLAQARERYSADLDPVTAAPLAVDASLVAHRLGRKETAVAQAQEALALAEQTGDPVALAQAHNLLGILARYAGASATAVAHLRQSLSFADAARDLDARIAARNNLALALAAHGDTAPALAALQEALALCRAAGDRHREAALRSNLADLHHAAGEEEHALDQFREAAAILAEIGEEHGTWQAEIWKLTEW